MQIAFVLPSAVLIGWLGGALADHLLHQKWIVIAGVIFGCISGLVYVVRMAVAAEKSSAQRRRRTGTARTGREREAPDSES